MVGGAMWYDNTLMDAVSVGKGAEDGDGANAAAAAAMVTTLYVSVWLRDPAEAARWRGIHFPFLQAVGARGAGPNGTDLVARIRVDSVTMTYLRSRRVVPNIRLVAPPVSGSASGGGGETAAVLKVYGLAATRLARAELPPGADSPIEEPLARWLPRYLASVRKRPGERPGGILPFLRTPVDEDADA